LAQHYEKCLVLKSEAEALKTQLEALSNQKSLDTTLALLQTAAAQAEEDAEKCAEDFLSGTTSVEQFLSEFKAHRQLAHMRKIKSDKLYEMMRNF